MQHHTSNISHSAVQGESFLGNEIVRQISAKIQGLGERQRSKTMINIFLTVLFKNISWVELVTNIIVLISKKSVIIYYLYVYGLLKQVYLL